MLTNEPSILPVNFVVGDCVIAKKPPIFAVNHDRRNQKDTLAFIKDKKLLHISGIHSHITRRRQIRSVVSVEERPGKRFDASDFFLVVQKTKLRSIQ